MGTWIITYQLKGDKLPHVYEVKGTACKEMEQAAKTAFKEFRSVFKDEINRGVIKNATLSYCFSYGSVPLDIDEPLF